MGAEEQELPPLFFVQNPAELRKVRIMPLHVADRDPFPGRGGRGGKFPGGLHRHRGRFFGEDGFAGFQRFPDVRKVPLHRRQHEYGVEFAGKQFLFAAARERHTPAARDRLRHFDAAAAHGGKFRRRIHRQTGNVRRLRHITAADDSDSDLFHRFDSFGLLR